jgi:hypothetical protein
MQIALEDLDGHRRLLLINALELIQALAERFRRRLVCPNRFCLPPIIPENAGGCGDDPIWQLVDVPMKFGWLLDGFCDPVWFVNDSRWIEMSQAALQFERRTPSTLGRHVLVEDNAQEKSKAILDDEAIGFRIFGEAGLPSDFVGRKRLTKLEQSGHDSCSAGVSELAGSQGRKCLAQDRDRVGLKTSSTSLFGLKLSDEGDGVRVEKNRFTQVLRLIVQVHQD